MTDNREGKLTTQYVTTRQFLAFIPSEDSQITRAHPLHPLHVAAHRGEILKAVRRDQYDVLEAHPANGLVAGQHLVVDKL